MKIHPLLFLFIFTGCSTKTIVTNAPMLGGTWIVEKDIKKNVSYKRSGIYKYPSLGTEYQLKRGKFNGVFKIISEENDTLFYSTYKNNLPVGRYVLKILDYNEQIINYRSIPVRPKLTFGYGSGMFNKHHQKDGIWIEQGQTVLYKNGEINSF